VGSEAITPAGDFALRQQRYGRKGGKEAPFPAWQEARSNGVQSRKEQRGGSGCVYTAQVEVARIKKKERPKIIIKKERLVVGAGKIGAGARNRRALLSDYPGVDDVNLGCRTRKL
jgi:hypothetical protein